jgi:hypothetical protein
MLTKSEAEGVLRPHYPNLKKALDGGLHAWHEHYKHRHVILDARARAAIIYCEIIDSAKVLFADRSDVKIVRKGVMYLFYVGDDIVLRFKKLRNGKPSNIKTKQQELFQKQQSSIAGFLPGTVVSAGYELDQLEQAIEKMLVVAQLNGKSVWALDLNIGEDEGQGKVTVMPPIPNDSIKPSRVVARAAKRRKEFNKDN